MQFPLRLSRDHLDPVLPLADQPRLAGNSKMSIVVGPGSNRGKRFHLTNAPPTEAAL
jgi:hypothetical protein